MGCTWNPDPESHGEEEGGWHASDEVQGIDPFRWLPYEVEHIGWSRTATGRNRLAEAEQLELHCVVLSVRGLLHGDPLRSGGRGGRIDVGNAVFEFHPSHHGAGAVTGELIAGGEAEEVLKRGRRLLSADAAGQHQRHAAGHHDDEAVHLACGLMCEPTAVCMQRENRSFAAADDSAGRK